MEFDKKSLSKATVQRMLNKNCLHMIGMKKEEAEAYLGVTPEKKETAPKKAPTKPKATKKTKAPVEEPVKEAEEADKAE